jgi:hypothetical protein
VKSKEESVAFFVWDICRSVKLEFSEETKVRGIPAYRHLVSKSVVDIGTTDPVTKCHCAGQCLPTGVVKVSKYLNGIPAFISYPHFLQRGSVLFNATEGIGTWSE